MINNNTNYKTTLKQLEPLQDYTDIFIKHYYSLAKIIDNLSYTSKSNNNNLDGVILIALSPIDNITKSRDLIYLDR
jgi:hypothetical protein